MLSSEKLGERIAEARKRAKLTQADVAAKVGVSRTTIVAMEKGERRPTSEELLRLKDALRTTLRALVQEGVSTATASARFRLNRPTDGNNKELETAIDQIEAFGRRYVELERICEIERAPAPLEAFQSYQSRGSDSSFSAAASGCDAARAVRGLLGLGDGPAIGLDERLELAAGLRIFRIALPKSVAALFVWGDELGACVGINRGHPPDRQRWSLTHEFGHFLRDREGGDVLPEGGPARLDVSEVFCESFTAEFLMPEAGVARQFNDRRRANGSAFSLADVFALADVYQVSFEAMMLRLEEPGLIPKGTLARLKIRAFKPEKARSDLGLVGGHPPRATPFPERYVTLALRAYENDDISDGELADYLDTDIVTARGIHLARREHTMEDGNSLIVDVGEDVFGPGRVQGA